MQRIAHMLALVAIVLGVSTLGFVTLTSSAATNAMLQPAVTE